MNLNPAFDFKKIAVIVAHPDDETLWAGGMILMHPHCNWTIICLSRKNDPDRAPKFFEALTLYGATGAMGNLDDGPEQKPLPQKEIEAAIQGVLPPLQYDLIVTHNPAGEYTRHRRHEETGRAVFDLWEKKILHSPELWLFAYEDHNPTGYARAKENSDRIMALPEPVRLKKYSMITKTYGFAPDSFEALTTPGTEAFECFKKEEKMNAVYKESNT